MAAPKRSAHERERDLERLSDLYCRGLSQQSLAEAFHVSRKQIWYDLQILYKRWQESALGRIDERKAQELARIDHLEAIAWQAWDRSCQNSEISTAELTQGRTKRDGSPLPDLKKSSKVSKGQAGDPRFLERIAWCIEQRCKIIGLHAPLKVAPTDPQGEHEYGELSDDEAATGLQNLYAILESRHLGPFGETNGHAAGPSAN